MPERDGYKTIDLIVQEAGVSEHKVRQAIEVLKLTPLIFNRDKRAKFYSPEDIRRILEWLESH